MRMSRLLLHSVRLTLLYCLAWPATVWAQVPPTQVATDGNALDAEIDHFYVARADAPLWFGSAAGDAPHQLIRLLNTAKADGIDPADFDIATLLLAVREAESGDAAAIGRAEPLLSRAYVNYARGVQRDPKVGVIYVDAGLKPAPKPAAILLDQIARAPSPAAFVRDLGWMNPLYGQLRAALVQHAAADPATRHKLALNLERARALPPARERYLIVNAANQKLTMYEHGKPVGEMKIGVGRADAQTPLMNAFVRYAVLNPYWNVPSDLVARMAPKVIRRGKRYLDQQGYEVVTGFDDGARIVDPATVDWQAVAAGKVVVSMRQKPGPANSMGKVKFMFPNTQGVWLHDTPSREHFAKDVRLVSSGCVRLEDAWRLGSWLFGRELRPSGKEPDRRLELRVPVPIYITYLTAIPEGPSVRFIADVYRRDLPPIAAP
jgi:murein L,D-transpeptidase YcbB/YkuD